MTWNLETDSCIPCSNLQTLRSKYGGDFSASEDTELLQAMQKSYIIIIGIKNQIWDRNIGIGGTDKIKVSNPDVFIA